jgi:hypothetical protein
MMDRVVIMMGMNSSTDNTTVSIKDPADLVLVVTLLRAILVTFGVLIACILVLETASLSAEKRDFSTVKRRIPLYLMTVLAVICYLISSTMAFADFTGYNELCYVLVVALIVCFIHSKQFMYLFL